jgi:hypothetical protein
VSRSSRRADPLRWRDAVRDSDLDPTAKLVAFVISTYMDGAGKCFPGKELLAQGSSLRSIRSVDYAVHRIESAGLIRVARSRGGGPNRYHAAVPHADAVLSPQRKTGCTTGNPACGGSKPRISLPKTPHAVAPESAEGAESGAPAAAPANAAPTAANRNSSPRRGRDLSSALRAEASAAHRTHPVDDLDLDDPDDDYEPATPEQVAIGMRGMAAVLGVAGPPVGDPVTTGTCERCEQDGLPLWPTGQLLACEPCWRAREAARTKLSADLQEQQAESSQ